MWRAAITAWLLAGAVGCSTKPVAVLPYDGPPVTAAAFSADGGRLVSGSSDGFVRVWDVAGRRELARWRAFDTPTRDRLAVWAVAISPDGRYVAFAVTGFGAQLWEWGAPAPPAPLPGPAPVA